MSSDLTSGRFGKDFQEKEKESEKKFKSHNMLEFIGSIYKEAIKKAKSNYKKDIQKKLNSFKEVTYSIAEYDRKVEQYKEAIRINFENDSSDYRLALQRTTNNIPKIDDDQFENALINNLFNVISEKAELFQHRLITIEHLFESVYESSRIEMMFNHFKALQKSPEELKIEKYSKIITSYYFNDTLEPKFENGKKNPSYAYDRIRNFVKYYLDYSSNLPLIENRIELCRDFINNLGEMMRFSVDLAKRLIEYEDNKHNPNKNEVRARHTPINLKINEIRLCLATLKNYKDNLNFNISEGHYELAIKLKIHFSTLLSGALNLLRDWMFIDLKLSPLSEEIEELINSIEKAFDVNEILILKDSSNIKKQVGNSIRPNRTDIAYFCYYTSESKELQTQNPFPSKKAWKEIGSQFGKDDTNIQKMYNIIYKSNDDRLKETKRNNIEYVIENMLSDYPKAIILANKELIKAN